MTTKPIRFTHTGTMKGCDARTPDGWSEVLHLYETKTQWVDDHGRRWDKKHGRKIPRSDWPMYFLDLTTVQRIP